MLIDLRMEKKIDFKNLLELATYLTCTNINLHFRYVIIETQKRPHLSIFSQLAPRYT